ncbi:MAG: DUF2460 domain-containing protein [Planctomycetota bacterium JB042]
MGFHDRAILTSDAKAGSSGGVGFETSIVATDSGTERVIRRPAGERRRFAVNLAGHAADDVLGVRNFYIVRHGIANGFRFLDLQDYSSKALDDFTADDLNPIFYAALGISATDQRIGTGDGSTDKFQLRKAYTVGATTKYRAITKPAEPFVLIAIDGAMKPSTFYSVDYATGVVSFDAAPAGSAVITAGFLFYTPARFGDEVDRLIQTSFDGVQEASLPSVPILEVTDLPETPESSPPDGARYEAIDSNLVLTNFRAGYVRVDPTVGSLQVRLPEIGATSPVGGPLLRIENVTGTNSFEIAEEDGTGLYTVPATAGAKVTIHVYRDSGGSPKYLILEL